MEPTVFKSISNYTVCNFFYIFFVAYAVLLGVIIVSGLATMLFVKMPAGQQIATGIMYGIAMAVAITQLLFMYLMCDRALIAPQLAQQLQQQPVETFRGR
jgi:hypothetical protein